MAQAPPKPERKVSQPLVSRRGESKPPVKDLTPLKSNVFPKSYVKMVLFIDKQDWDDLVRGNYEAWGDIVLRRNPLEPSVRVEVRMKKLPKERRDRP